MRYTLSSFIVVLVGLLLGYRPAGGFLSVIAAIALLNVCAFGFGWIFTTLGIALRTPGSVMTFSWLFLMPLTFASNIYVDPATMPGWLQAFVAVNPVALVVTGFGPWSERRVTAEAAAAEAARTAVLELSVEAGSVRSQRWGDYNRLDMSHPLGRFFPSLRDWLGVEQDAVAGDSFAPNALHRGHGPSERFVVSPGREAAGIMHLPGGASGHPMSPFFRAGHEAWVRGEPMPFLPGPAVHRLRLVSSAVRRE